MATTLYIKSADTGAYVSVTGLNYADVGLSSAAVQPIMNVPIHCSASAFATWTDMPLAATLFLGSARYNQIVKVDLTNYTQARLSFVVGTAGVSGAKLIARYATSLSATPVGSDFTADLGTSEISGVLTTGATVVTSSWINIATLAKADVYLAIIGSGGDGAVDPTIGNTQIQFR